MIKELTVQELTSDYSLFEQVFFEIKRSVDNSQDPADSQAAVWNDVQHGRAQCHVITLDDSAEVLATFITFIKHRKDGNSLHVWQLAGKYMKHWLDEFLAYLDELATGEGCEMVTFGGRPGWVKMLAHRGYVTESVLMRRALL